MIIDVKRGYVPRCESVRNAFVQKSLATIQAFDGANGTFPNKLCPVKLNPSLPHRKVWAWLFSVSGTWSVDADVVFYLNGSEVFRHKLHVWNAVAVNNQYSIGFSPVSTLIGTANESLTVLMANTSTFMSSPHRWNIAADSAVICANTLTGGAALFDGTLMIQSQAGL